MAPDRAGPDLASADVVIVGAGLAGLQCARLVGEAGLDVVLLDRKEDLRDRVHTTGIFVRKSLEDFDLPPSCLGPPIRRVALYSPARRALRLSSRRDEFRVGRMGTLYRELLDRCLAAGVRFLPGTRYRGSRPAGTGLVVELERDGKGLNIETRLLVGADGANSQVARDLGLDSNSDWLVGLEWVYTGVPLSGPATLHCFLDPRIAPGYLAWVVQDGEETHVGVGGYPGRGPRPRSRNSRAAWRASSPSTGAGSWSSAGAGSRSTGCCAGSAATAACSSATRRGRFHR